MKKPQKIKNPHDQKRFGRHHRRTKAFNNTYLPYLPMTVILLLSIFISGYNPKQATLAYATNMSHQGLLDATNTKRSQNSKAGLSLNSQLNSAAQAKANDMVSRNYWSHNTPDGQEPWVFVNATGYSYLKAGENLAYGFLTSSATVDGWMNSQSHKDNMLDGDFVDVGFGFANSSNYNNAGEETIVVAMYAKPYVLASTTEPAPAAPEPVAPPSTTTPNQQPTPSAPAPAPAEQPTAKPAEPQATPSTTESEPAFVVADARPVSRAEVISNWDSPWLVGGISFITGLLATILLIRHGNRLKHLLRDSQNFITHHPLIDSTILALIILGITLTRTVGFIL